MLQYLHSDHLGSTTLTTDSSGNQIGSQQYRAYGLQRGGDGVPTENQFTGQKQDSSGLQYFAARYYDPQTGLFVSPDTLVPDPGRVFGYNRSMYSFGNPLKFVDPSGHDPCDNGSKNCDNNGLEDWIGDEQYVYIPGYGMFDLDHVKYSTQKIQDVVQQIQDVLDGKREYVEKIQGVGLIDKGAVTARYEIVDTLSKDQIEQVALGIMIHFEKVVEANQSVTSVYSVEDLPSDYIGWYVGLNPGTSELSILTQLSYNTRKGNTMNAVEAMIHKLQHNQNFEPLPMNGNENVNWPPLLTMEVAQSNGGTWTALDVTVSD